MNIRIALLTTAALATCAFAQSGTGGTAVNGFTSFTITDSPTTGTANAPSADFRVGGLGNPDHLTSSWWWFRMPGDTRETAFSNATSSAWSGNTGRMDFVYPSFTATMIFRVTGIVNGFGVLTETVTIRNTTNSAIALDLFNFNNIDLAGTAGDDITTQPAVNIVRFTDSALPGWRADYEGTNAFAFDAANNIHTLLTDATATNFSGTGAVGSGDREGAHQWRINLAAGDAATASATITIVPTPGVSALAAMGAGLMIRRRR
ncbi:MAG: hypothetical protein KGS45_12515 [Planctomycetes bacterium]|nr:hypothetical protein [Planctomycetota bacterium]